MNYSLTNFLNIVHAFVRRLIILYGKLTIKLIYLLFIKTI